MCLQLEVDVRSFQRQCPQTLQPLIIDLHTGYIVCIISITYTLRLLEICVSLITTSNSISNACKFLHLAMLFMINILILGVMLTTYLELP